jgi:ABC-type transport system substrate-binding protein
MGNVVRNIVVQVVHDNLRNIGIDAQVDLQPASKLFGAGGTLEAGTYDLSEFAWITSGTGEGGFDVWGTGFSQNYQRYSNPNVDNLLSQLHSAKDPNVSDELSAKLQVTLMQDIVVVPLFPRVNVDVASHNFQNWQVPGEHSKRFHNAAQWFFK